ncbi:hypothetical protein V8E54_005645 [Elaphomyces granulatus]
MKLPHTVGTVKRRHGGQEQSGSRVCLNTRGVDISTLGFCDIHPDCDWENRTWAYREELVSVPEIWIGLRANYVENAKERSVYYLWEVGSFAHGHRSSSLYLRSKRLEIRLIQRCTLAGAA